MAETALSFVNHGWRKFWNSLSSNGINYTSIRPSWLEKILKFIILKWLKLHFHSSTMVGENFKIHCPQMAETALSFVNHDWRKFWSSASSNGWIFTSIRQLWFEKISKFTILKCLKLHFYSSTIVVKKLKFTILKWLKLHFYSSIMVGENFEICYLQMAETAIPSV